MRKAYESRIRLLEKKLLPEIMPKYHFVAYHEPGDRGAEAEAEEWREKGYTVIEVRVVGSKEDIEAWKEYDTEEGRE